MPTPDGNPDAPVPEPDPEDRGTKPSGPDPPAAARRPPGEGDDLPPAPARRRPTGLIALCVLLGVAAVGLGIWAFSAQSDADDVRQELAAAEQAAAQTTPEPAATAEPDATDPAADGLSGQLERLADEAGALDDSVEDVQQQVATAKDRFDQAQADRDAAEGAVDSARAELDALRTRAELAGACLRGTLNAVTSAYESGGVEAARTQLEQLAGDCRDAAAAG